MKVAIVTDTNSGITPEEAEREGIYLVPMPVIIDGKCCLEGIDISIGQLFEAMKKGCSISTSQPSPGYIMDLWASLFEKGYDEIVHIPMSSGLSGSCHATSSLADEYDKKVYVVDNHRISVTQRASVIEAKNMADDGYSAKEIKAYLESTALHSSIYLTVESLKYLQKGGRLSPSAAMLGTMLNIKPILSIQGEQIEAYAKMRGMKKSEGKMIEAIQTDIIRIFGDISGDKYRVDTGGSLQKNEDIEHWKDIVQYAFPDKQIEYYTVPCSIACHVGPECIGIAVSVS